MRRQTLFNGSYMSIFKEGKKIDAGCSDGVGFVGEVDEAELREMYEVLKKHFESKKGSKNGKF